MRLILTTFAHADDAARVIRQLVEEKLVACGTILPGARSIYAWQGVIEDASEAMVLLKTSVDRVSEAQSRLLALHPYETAEVVVLSPESVAPRYLAWVLEQCGSSIS
jgi:periplasmic divalent cation tolerance protein